MERNYKQIFSWENKERIKYLENFNSHVVNYFKNIGHSRAGDSWEEEPAKIERKEINKLIDKAHSYIIATDVSPEIIYYPAPITGRESRYTDLVLNIFNLIKMHMGHRPLLDVIERTIARYENDKKSAILRTWFPIFWFTLFIDWIVSLPFEFLSKFGFQQDKLETSLGGRIFKFLFSLIVYVEAFLNVLERIGYLPKLLIIMEKLFK